MTPQWLSVQVVGVGTFTRLTIRPFTHVVIARGLRAERLEALRLEQLASLERAAATSRWAADALPRERRKPSITADRPVPGARTADEWVAVSWHLTAAAARGRAGSKHYARYREVWVVDVVTGAVIDQIARYRGRGREA